MPINWYPGHMHKTRRLIGEHLRKCDLIVEVRDARIPESSANPLIPEIIGTHPRLILLNKADLADPECTTSWCEYLETVPGTSAMSWSCTEETGVSAITGRVREICRKAEWFGTRPMRIMVVGVPNVGKSTLINRFIGRRKLNVSNKPAVTKEFRLEKITSDLQLVDTPGILWPKFEDQSVGARLAILGSIKDTLLEMDTLAVFAVEFLSAHYPALLAERYRLEELDEDPIEVLTSIGEKRAFKMKGGLVDYDRTCRLLIQEIRAGLVGRITWDLIPE